MQSSNVMQARKPAASWSVGLNLAGLLFSAVALAVPVAAQGPVDNGSGEKDLHLFLLTGQSNMAGRGRIDKSNRKSHPRVLMFNKEGEWVPAADPLHFDKPRVVGVGLGISFAIDYAEQNPEAVVGLIPCAVGGSPIDAWKPGGYHKSTKTHPWDDAIRRAEKALESGTLKGILWHQGESDSKPELAEAYEEKLHELVERFRSVLKSNDVPFIAGQMGRFEGRPWTPEREQVDKAHRQLPEKVKRTAFVSAMGLTDKGDLVHFDSASYRELGHRYFQAYREMVGRPEENPRDRPAPNDRASGMVIERMVAHRGFDGKRCWVHARAGLIPAEAAKSREPLFVMTTQPLQLSGSDVFYALSQTRSHDNGRTWSDLQRCETFARRVTDAGQEYTVCDFTPMWHRKTGKLLGTGQTVWYEHNRVMHVRPRSTAYAIYDLAIGQWGSWRRVEMPNEVKFRNAGAGSVQRYDLETGEILMPIYFKDPKQRRYSTTVCRCSFDGESLKYIEHGSELTVDVKRGLYEPSITRFRGRYYLTMRNDDHGYVSVSDNGLTYEPVKRWNFDDGSDLGNYNTQQHWVTSRDGLYLVYTRRGANNDHVFRHRAPLFIAQVDPMRLHVIRATEKVLVPEHGARLGNFGVTQVSATESWVTVTEWMQPIGVEKYGSDNRIFVVKLKWNDPS